MYCLYRWEGQEGRGERGDEEGGKRGEEGKVRKR